MHLPGRAESGHHRGQAFLSPSGQDLRGEPVGQDREEDGVARVVADESKEVELGGRSGEKRGRGEAGPGAAEPPGENRQQRQGEQVRRHHEAVEDERVAGEDDLRPEVEREEAAGSAAAPGELGAAGRKLLGDERRPAQVAVAPHRVHDLRFRGLSRQYSECAGPQENGQRGESEQAQDHAQPRASRPRSERRTGRSNPRCSPILTIAVKHTVHATPARGAMTCSGIGATWYCWCTR